MPLDTPRNPFRNDRYDPVNVTLADPGVGNDLLWPVPANQVIDVVGLSFMVLTSGVALNRRALVGVQTPGPLYVPVTASSVVQTAGLFWQYHFSPGVPALDATADLIPFLFGSLPVSMEMKFGDSFSIRLSAIDPGDQIMAIFLRCRLWSED